MTTHSDAYLHVNVHMFKIFHEYWVVSFCLILSYLFFQVNADHDLVGVLQKHILEDYQSQKVYVIFERLNFLSSRKKRRVYIHKSGSF